MHNLIIPSFLCNKRIGASHNDTLDCMNPRSNNSYHWTFSSLSSARAIQYGALDISVALDTKSIAKSISLLGGNPGKSSGTTFRNSHATGMSSSRGFAISLSTTWARKPQQPYLINLSICIAEIKYGGAKIPEHLTLNFRTPSNLKITRFSK